MTCRQRDCTKPSGHGLKGRYCRQHARSLVIGAWAIATGLFILLLLSSYLATRVS